jgi:DNA-binding transcriptional regulator YdaS (Cro superfamily)
MSRMLVIDCLAQIEKLSIIRCMTTEQQAALESAISAAGGITQLAKSLGVKSRGVVHSWRLNRVPAEYCPRIEQITGVQCELLRPDVSWGVLRNPPAASDAHTAQAAEQGVANA